MVSSSVDRCFRSLHLKQCANVDPDVKKKKKRQTLTRVGVGWVRGSSWGRGQVRMGIWSPPPGNLCKYTKKAPGNHNILLSFGPLYIMSLGPPAIFFLILACLKKNMMTTMML